MLATCCALTAVVSVVTLAIVARAAIAHPGASFKSAAWAKAQIFNPGKAKFDDRSVSCVGIGVRSGNLFRHFRCTDIRNDGVHFSMIVHTGAPTVISFIDVIGTGGYHKRVLGSKSIAGDYATAIVSGQLDQPVRMFLRIFVRPDQRVTGNWTVVCSNDSGASSKSGRFNSGFDLTDVEIKFPFDSPSSCTASAAASVNGSAGKLTLQIIGYY